ncbi:MFS transporter [Streptoalloteichus hindustanus]|uniref:MFS transporter, DHA2 family, multidrug resistance protein n=1 Tax=Streptoalloteichus hindustanus TaxID=2017 RepID=A0A1M5I9Q6_STRHI|nr:MFS transporter [Streptoalloteichus hindustanus]SHG25128.1 MFS transporter, DHA2 family, multidrug resistance protein [Streptoalloteichus hindustanus]
MSAHVHPRAGAREWLGLAVLLLPTTLLFLAMTVLFLANPYIAADLRPTGAQMLWVNDVYGFMMAGLLVAMGTVGDRIGRRKVLLFGAVIFGVTSVVAAFAPNAETLIVARALMGVGAAAVMPSTLSLISNMFRDDRQRATAIGLWAASVSVGVAIGPLVGGLLLTSFWWGAALLIGVPIMALVAVAAPLLVPEYRAPGTGVPDFASVLLSMATLLPFVYGVKEFSKSGLNPTAVLTLLAGAAFGVWFVRRQLRLETPLLDMRLFANRTFSGALSVFLLAATALGGMYLLFTQYLQLVAGLSPLAAGLWILPAAVALVVVSTVSPIIARRVRPAYVVAAGMLSSLIGYALLTQVESVAGLPLLIVGFYVLYPGIAPTMALTTGLVIGSAPQEKAGAASAVNSTASDLGVSLGIALMGSISSAVYHARMPGDAPAAAADSLPGALAAAETLPADAARALVEPARAAFTGGLNVAAVVAMVLVTGAGLLAVTLLRRVPASGAAPEPETVEADKQVVGAAA